MRLNKNILLKNSILFTIFFLSISCQRNQMEVIYKRDSLEFYLPQNYYIINYPDKKVKHKLTVDKQDLDSINNTISKYDFFNINNNINILDSIGFVFGIGYSLKVNYKNNSNYIFLESLNEEYYENNENNINLIIILKTIDSILYHKNSSLFVE